MVGVDFRRYENQKNIWERFFADEGVVPLTLSESVTKVRIKRLNRITNKSDKHESRTKSIGQNSKNYRNLVFVTGNYRDTRLYGIPFTDLRFERSGKNTDKPDRARIPFQDKTLL